MKKTNIREVKMAKKVCISGYYGFGNFGDEAILDVLIKFLKQNKSDITVFTKNPKITASKHRVKCVNTFDILSVMKNIKDNDVLFSGGGSLFQDKTSLKSLLYYMFVVYYALKQKKQVVIFAQGIGPIKNIFAKMFLKNILKNCDFVTVRDDGSLFLLRGWGILCEKVNDPIWNLELPPYNPQNKVGIQLRNDKYLTENFLIELASLVLHHFKGYDIEIYSYQDSLDYDVCYQFKDLINLKSPMTNVKFYYGLSNSDIIQKTSELNYMIAMRFHACLLALKYGIKTAAINYDVKVKNLANEFDIPCMNLGNDNKMDYYISQLKRLSRHEIMEKVSKKRLDMDVFKCYVEQ